MEEKASNFVKSSNGGHDGKEKNPQLAVVREFFSPLRTNWPILQEILLWQRFEVAILCFNIINGLFWVFLSGCLRTCVSFVIVGSWLWLVPPWRLWVLSMINTRKVSTKRQENINENSDNSGVEDSSEVPDDDTRSEEKATSYEDFCYGATVIWGFILKYYIKLKDIKEDKPQKFYALVALLVILLAILYQRVPVGNILYLTIMFLFLWPAIVFYGIKDKFVGKLRRLFKPFFTQWQNSRTKRKRNATFKGRIEGSDLSEDDEDFTLNTGNETEKILGSVLPVERLKQESHHGLFDSLDSSTFSTDGLEFPSLRRGSVDSYNSDDFTNGLNFASLDADVARSCHSSMDSLVDEGNDSEHSKNERVVLRRDEEIHVNEGGLARREDDYVGNQTQTNQSLSQQSRNESSDSLHSYEIVEPSEIENVPTTQSSSESPSNDKSYLASGMGYVGKFLGYS